MLYPALLKYHGKPTEAPGAVRRSLRGAELIDDVVMVDQTPIGRTTRSNPASYVGAFDEIRALFAAEPAALERKYTAGTFSFNSGNGRCPTCSGNGFEHVEMQFLSDVYLRCPDCDGRRYRDEVLDVKREGADGRAREHRRGAGHDRHARRCAFFAESRRSGARACSRSPTWVWIREARPAGADAVRRRGAAAEARRPPGRSRRRGAHAAPRHRGKLFMFDEPTTGLHFEDIAKLMQAFGKLLAAGHSLLVIEHNLDVIRAADWIIDLGPEGGERGGNIVCAGTPGAGARAAGIASPAGARRLRAGAVAQRRVAGASRVARRRAARAVGRGNGQRRERGRHPQRARAQPQEHGRARSRATASP